MARLASLALAATLAGACLTGSAAAADTTTPTGAAPAQTTTVGGAPAGTLLPGADSWSAVPRLGGAVGVHPDSDSWS